MPGKCITVKYPGIPEALPILAESPEEYRDMVDGIIRHAYAASLGWLDGLLGSLPCTIHYAVDPCVIIVHGSVSPEQDYPVLRRVVDDVPPVSSWRFGGRAVFGPRLAGYVVFPYVSPVSMAGPDAVGEGAPVAWVH